MKTKYIFLFLLIIAGVFADENNLQASVKVLGDFITIFSPIEGEMYNTKSIVVNASLAETAKTLYYQINTKNWIKACSNCNTYIKKLSFAEGENNITLQATDYGNTTYLKSVSFEVDTKKPDIKAISPKSYSNGIFGVKYTELNLEHVHLFYDTSSSSFGNQQEMSCEPGTDLWCFSNIDVSGYEGKEFYYQFSLEDEFNSVYSKKTKVIIDTISPILKVYSPENKNYVNSYGKVYLNLESSEKSKLEYSDNNGSWVKLCSSCLSWKGYKKFSFGSHDVTFKAEDLAGNKDEINIEFNLSKN